MGMVEEIREMLDNESMITLVRSNLSYHFGKILDVYNIDEITCQIVESINYLINKQNAD